MLQYENSTALNRTKDGFRDILSLFIKPDSFYNDYFNLHTAVGQGLDNWGRILDISRKIYLEDYGNIFGYDVNPLNDIDYAQNFYSGTPPLRGGSFFNTGYQSQRYVILPDLAYRNLLILKYYRSIANGSLSIINDIMKNYFGDRGQPQIIEGDMELTYNFTTVTSVQDYEISLFNQLNILPTPSGVTQILIFS